MKLISNIIFGIALAGLCGTVCSCDSFLKEYSQDLAKVNTWQDLDEVLLGSGYIKTGRYYVQNSTAYSERDCDFDFLHYLGDELHFDSYIFNNMPAYENYFAYFTWQRDTSVDNNFHTITGDEEGFNVPYDKINVCNMVISMIDDMPETAPGDEMEKRRVKGEAYFLRGLYYFFLANLYCLPYDPATAASAAGMPLKFSEIVEDKEYSRTTLKETYQAIMNDLDIAAKCLEGTTRKSKYHPDVATVHLLQSRVYLYMQDWENAALKAKEVLEYNDGLLNIGTIPVGGECLYGESPEVLFAMGEYLISFSFVDTRSSVPTLQISADMRDLYTVDDYRKDRYIGETDNSHGVVLRKVNGQKAAYGSYSTVGSVFTFRTPEAYLTLAETSAYMGDENASRRYLGEFLSTRMKRNADVTASGKELIDLIRDERAREFILEGHRWFDLRRYTVCTPYPWSKEIVHGYPYNADYSYDRTDWYRLEKNDQAYTLPIPRTVRNFQNSLEVISRPLRTAFATTSAHGLTYEEAVSSEGEEEEWDDEDW